MLSRIVLVMLVVLTSAALAILRQQLVGIESRGMSVWPSHVIFGLYFAVFAFAVQMLQPIGAHRPGPRQSLLLLILIGVCLDLVLVNVSEVLTTVDASYGLVVLWDMATFFVWLRAIELCRRGNDEAFYASRMVALAPLFKLGREVLFIPYAAPAEQAYFDFATGDVLVSLWALMRPRPDIEGFDRFLAMAVFTGCVYWLISTLQNIAFIAWPPLQPLIYKLLTEAELPSFVLNVLFLLMSLMTTFAVVLWNLAGIGSHFGLSTSRPPRSS